MNRFISLAASVPMAIAAASVPASASSDDEATAVCNNPTAVELFSKGTFLAWAEAKSATIDGETAEVGMKDPEKRKMWEAMSKAQQALQLLMRSGSSSDLKMEPGTIDVTVIGGRATSEPGMYICAVSYALGKNIPDKKVHVFEFSHRWKVEVVGKMITLYNTH